MAAGTCPQPEEVAPARGMADVRHPEQDLAVVTETFRCLGAHSLGADYERKGGEVADDTGSE
jgi:hypothetical protein